MTEVTYKATTHMPAVLWTGCAIPLACEAGRQSLTYAKSHRTPLIQAVFQDEGSGEALRRQ